MKYGANLYDVINNTWKNPWTVGQIWSLANPIFPKCHDLIIFNGSPGRHNVQCTSYINQLQGFG